MSHRHHRLVAAVGALLLLALFVPQPPAARAASPGELITQINATLAANYTTQPYDLFQPSSELANIRVSVSGGAAGASATLIVRQGAADMASWQVRNGETTWGTATLPAGSKLVLRNDSASSLAVAVEVYSADVLPRIAVGIDTWQGTSDAAGIVPAITLSAPASGLYRFTMSATSGAYQFLVDGLGDAAARPHVRKTVKAGSAPADTDSVYYLPAGQHTFAIQQDTAAGAVGWSVKIAPVGGNDALPSDEDGAALGGVAFFREEWVPIQVPADQQVNIRVSATGAAADSLGVELFNGATRVYSSTTIVGGEVTWGSTGLTAGANALHVVTRANNAAPLAFQVHIEAVGAAPFDWAGKTAGSTDRAASGHSTIRLSFPTSGLYNFTLGAAAGRFQFLLGSNYFKKTITDTTTLSAYVEAGTYALEVAQDPLAALTDWSVKVQAGSAPADSLPYSRTGGGLASVSGTTFSDEWLPIQMAADAAVNIKVVVHGASGDSLRLELFNGEGSRYSAATVYGGETFWASTGLATGANRLHLSATGSNLSYEVIVDGVAVIPASGAWQWAGESRPNGLTSFIRLNAPVDGIYSVVLNVAQGAARPVIGGDSDQPTRSGAVVTLRVPLASGLHTFTVEQDSALAEATSWTMSVDLQRATSALTITGVTPASLTQGTATAVTVNGSSFQNSTAVELLPASGAPIALTDTVVVSGTQLRVTVPASVPAGSYGLRVTNPGGQSATRNGAITVTAAVTPPGPGQKKYSAFMPVVWR